MLPFGDGLRSCPGEGLADIQMFIFTTILFYHLQFTLVDTPELDGLSKGFVLGPKPYKVKLSARDTLPLYQDVVDADVVDTTLFLDNF